MRIDAVSQTENLTSGAPHDASSKLAAEALVESAGKRHATCFPVTQASKRSY